MNTDGTVEMMENNIVNDEQSTKKQVKTKKKKTILIIALIIVGLLIGGGVYFYYNIYGVGFLNLASEESIREALVGTWKDEKTGNYFVIYDSGTYGVAVAYYFSDWESMQKDIDSSVKWISMYRDYRDEVKGIPGDEEVVSGGTVLKYPLYPKCTLLPIQGIDKSNNTVSISGGSVEYLGMDQVGEDVTFQISWNGVLSYNDCKVKKISKSTQIIRTMVEDYVEQYGEEYSKLYKKAARDFIDKKLAEVKSKAKAKEYSSSTIYEMVNQVADSFFDLQDIDIWITGQYGEDKSILEDGFNVMIMDDGNESLGKLALCAICLTNQYEEGTNGYELGESAYKWIEACSYGCTESEKENAFAELQIYIETITDRELVDNREAKAAFDEKYSNLPSYKDAKYDALNYLGENFLIPDATLELSDYYNYDYRDLSPVYFSIRVTPGDSYDYWYIYASRNEFSELLEKLKNGKIKTSIVAMSYFYESLPKSMATLVDYVKSTVNDEKEEDIDNMITVINSDADVISGLVKSGKYGNGDTVLSIDSDGLMKGDKTIMEEIVNTLNGYYGFSFTSIGKGMYYRIEGWNCGEVTYCYSVSGSDVTIKRK